MHGNGLHKMDEVTHRARLGRGIAQLAQAHLQSNEHILEHLLIGGAHQAAECRKRLVDLRYGEVVARGNPRGEKVLVVDEVAETALSIADGLPVLFGQLLHVGRRHALGEKELLLFLGQVLVEDEAEDEVLVLACIHLAAHAVGRFPDFRGELLLVHRSVPFDASTDRFIITNAVVQREPQEGQPTKRGDRSRPSG